MDGVSDDDQQSAKNEKLLGSIKKQTKLATVAFLSTLFIQYSTAFLTAMVGFAWIDLIINAFCVYCTFDFPSNRNVFQYLCECNGNTVIQCMCCFCCCCCHQT